MVQNHGVLSTRLGYNIVWFYLRLLKVEKKINCIKYAIEQWENQDSEVIHPYYFT